MASLEIEIEEEQLERVFAAFAFLNPPRDGESAEDNAKRIIVDYILSHVHEAERQQKTRDARSGVGEDAGLVRAAMRKGGGSDGRSSR